MVFKFLKRKLSLAFLAERISASPILERSYAHVGDNVSPPINFNFATDGLFIADNPIVRDSQRFAIVRDLKLEVLALRYNLNLAKQATEIVHQFYRRLQERQAASEANAASFLNRRSAIDSLHLRRALQKQRVDVIQSNCREVQNRLAFLDGAKEHEIAFRDLILEGAQMWRDRLPADLKQRVLQFCDVTNDLEEIRKWEIEGV